MLSSVGAGTNSTIGKKIHFWHLVPSPGCTQKTKLSVSDTNEDLLSRAMRKEESSISYN